MKDARLFLTVLVRVCAGPWSMAECDVQIIDRLIAADDCSSRSQCGGCRRL